MRFGTTRTWAIGAAAAGIAFAGYTIGSQADDGVANGQSKSDCPKIAFAGPGLGGPMAEDLADRLGVDRQKLEDALRDIRPDLKGPSDPKRDFLARLADKLGVDQDKLEKVLEAQGPKRVERRHEERSELTNELADELGVSAAKVRAAFEVGKQGPNGPPPDKEEFLSGVAKELGVSKDRLVAALDKFQPRVRGHFHAGPPAAELAKGLGVDEAKVQAALDDLSKEMEAEHARIRDELAKALADRLGIDLEKVKAALPDGPVGPPKPRP
jgi:transcriptional regulator with XRE-family HTH domain